VVTIWTTTCFKIQQLNILPAGCYGFGVIFRTNNNYSLKRDKPADIFNGNACVFFVVRTEFLNIILISFDFKGLMLITATWLCLRALVSRNKIKYRKWWKIRLSRRVKFMLCVSYWTRLKNLAQNICKLVATVTTILLSVNSASYNTFRCNKNINMFSFKANKTID
jgi:hypothetical protein